MNLHRVERDDIKEIIAREWDLMKDVVNMSCNDNIRYICSDSSIVPVVMIPSVTMPNGKLAVIKPSRHDSSSTENKDIEVQT